MPRTMASSMPCEGSKRSWSCGFPAPPKNARPAASPNPPGITTATVVLPRRTASRDSSTVPPATSSALSAERPCTIALEMTLWSWSTTRTGTRALSEPFEPEKMNPKNEAMAMGAAKLMINARRSVKNSSRSLRTMARHAWSAISPSACAR
jgi:hypothetical protein